MSASHVQLHIRTVMSGFGSESVSVSVSVSVSGSFKCSSLSLSSVFVGISDAPEKLSFGWAEMLNRRIK